MYLHTAQYGSPPGIAKRLDKLFDNMGGLPAQSLISLLSFASGSLWFISQPIPAIHYIPPPLANVPLQDVLDPFGMLQVRTHISVSALVIWRAGMESGRGAYRWVGAQELRHGTWFTGFLW